jgi:hypothetical protein
MFKDAMLSKTSETCSAEGCDATSNELEFESEPDLTWLKFKLRMLATRFGANASGTAGEFASSVMAFETIDMASVESDRNRLGAMRM